MHFATDLSTALENIEAVKAIIDNSDDAKLQMKTADNLQMLLDLLQDPVLRSIVQVQDSLSDLNKQIVQHPSMLAADFDINLSGELALNVPASPDQFDASDYAPDVQVASPRHHLNATSPPGEHADPSTVPQPPVADKPALADPMSAEWALIQSLELVNDGTGLGFGIIGARTAGVIVKTIMPGGVADRDGRLLSGDHILRIGDVDLHDMVSEQVASVLRQSGTHVRLVVARSIDAMHAGAPESDGCLVVPGRLLTQPRELDRYMVAAGYSDLLPNSTSSLSTAVSTPLYPRSPAVSPPPPPLPAQQPPAMHDQDFGLHELALGSATPASIANRPAMMLPTSAELELPETDRFIVELTKDANGLGITIAGYVCEKEELSGIFVKSVSPGSAADLSGRIRVNDRIIEVDQQSLQGFSNHQAVDVLKKSGAVVRLCLERYLRGPKFEQLQQAIAANETTVGASAGGAVTAVPPSQATVAVVSPVPMAKRPTGGQATAVNGTPMRRPSFGDGAAVASVIGASGQSRKLLSNARDSLESRPPALPAIDIDYGSSVSVDEPVSPPHASLAVPVAIGAPPSPSALLPHVVGATSPLMRHKYWVEPVLTPDIEESIRQHWRALMPPDTRIIVAQIRKFAATSGLGISLEGTVDVEGGMEVRPHHYIRSILPEGPVGQNGQLRSSDELLEVNNQRLLGMNHLEVVSILKELPQDVRMVCARARNPADQMVPFTEDNLRKSITVAANQFGGSQTLSDKMAAAASDRLVKAKSDGSLATNAGSADDSLSKLKSRSLEPLTGLAMWSSEPQIIELVKGDRGLGFSILDYQDPLDANDTLIVIRSLVPGGVAQLDGRLIPGDRLLFVNDINLENSSLDQAVQALKGAPRGVVRIGVAKPLPMAENSLNLAADAAEEPPAIVRHPLMTNAAAGQIIVPEQDVVPDWRGK